MSDRVTSRNRKHARLTTKAADVLLKRLEQAEFMRECGFTQDQIDMLDQIANGHPPRNAAAILRGMELKASYGYSKPPQHDELSGEVVHRVIIERKEPDAG